MTKEDKDSYLRSALRFKQATFQAYANGTKPNPTVGSFFSLLPKSLFKYRQFDKYSREMIDESYLYLCPAELLDDPFECLLDFDTKDYFDDEDGSITQDCFQMMVETALLYAAKDQKDKTRALLYSCVNQDLTFNRSKALEVFHEAQDNLPGVDVPRILNLLANIPEQIQTPEVRDSMLKLLELSMDARKNMGICSLTENPKSEVMWAMYGANYQGYCIEYDFEHSVDAALDTFPVIYENGRLNNVVAALVQQYMNGAVDLFSNGAIETDQTQYFRTFLTKNEEWAF